MLAALLLLRTGPPEEAQEAGAPERAAPVFPGDTWKPRPPEAFGWDPAALRALERALGFASAGCVVRDGYLVRAWDRGWARRLWPPARRRGWASATKPYISTLLLFAVHERRIPRLEHPVVEAGWPLREADRDMTLHQLVNMTSGYGLPEAPGEAFAYNDYGVSLLFRTTIEHVFGVAPDDLEAVEKVLLDPARLGALRFEGNRVFRLRHGLPRLDQDPCDVARFGLFVKRQGRWGDEQLLPVELLRKAIRPAVPDSLPRTAGGPVDDYLRVGTAGGGHDQTALGPGVYGFQWWFNVDGRLWPDVPRDAFQTNGHWNRHALTIIPSLGLVVAWREASALASSPDAFHVDMNEALKLLMPSH
jgi:hypothetical protein